MAVSCQESSYQSLRFDLMTIRDVDYHFLTAESLDDFFFHFELFFYDANMYSRAGPKRMSAMPVCVDEVIGTRRKIIYILRKGITHIISIDTIFPK